MTYYLIKLLISASLIVLISEISRRSSLAGSILASIPLVSVLAMIWLYIDTGDIEKVSNLATGIFWLVIPSLSLFISLPLLLKYDVNFYLSMGLSIIFTILSYYLMLGILHHFGIHL